MHFFTETILPYILFFFQSLPGSTQKRNSRGMGKNAIKPFVGISGFVLVNQCELLLCQFWDSLLAFFPSIGKNPHPYILSISLLLKVMQIE